MHNNQKKPISFYCWKLLSKSHSNWYKVLGNLFFSLRLLLLHSTFLFLVCLFVVCAQSALRMSHPRSENNKTTRRDRKRKKIIFHSYFSFRLIQFDLLLFCLFRCCFFIFICFSPLFCRLWLSLDAIFSLRELRHSPLHNDRVHCSRTQFRQLFLCFCLVVFFIQNETETISKYKQTSSNSLLTAMRSTIFVVFEWAREYVT